MKTNILDMSSIGVIGGADGPTAIFVTSSPDLPYIIAGIVTAIVIAIGAVALFMGLKKRAKKKQS